MTFADWDHPILFVLLITLAVLAMASLITAGAKAVGLTGLATLAQNP